MTKGLEICGGASTGVRGYRVMTLYIIVGLDHFFTIGGKYLLVFPTITHLSTSCRRYGSLPLHPHMHALAHMPSFLATQGSQ